MKACILYAGFFRLYPNFTSDLIEFQKKVFIKPFHHGIGKMAFAVLSNVNEYAVKPEYYTVRYLFYGVSPLSFIIPRLFSVSFPNRIMSEWSAPEFESKSVRPKSWRSVWRHCPVRWCLPTAVRYSPPRPCNLSGAGEIGRCGFGVGVEYRCFGAPSGQGDDRPINPLKTARQWQRRWRA